MDGNAPRRRVSMRKASALDRLAFGFPALSETREGQTMSEPASLEKLDEPAVANPSQARPTAISQGAQSSHNYVRWLVLLAGLVAGLIAFGIGEMIYKIIPAEKVLQSVMMTNAKVMLPTRATENVAATKNAALAFGLLGLCLGSGLGIAGGLARKSAPAAIRGGLLGAGLGLALGGALSLGLLPLFLRQQERYADNELLVLIISLVMHALIWGLLGAIAGLAFAVGWENPRLSRRASAAGFVGAVVGTVVFELAGGLLFPLAATHQPISESWPTRLMARLLVSLATAGALVSVLSKSEALAAASRTDPTAGTAQP
jgi:hypothetical protein